MRREMGEKWERNGEGNEKEMKRNKNNNNNNNNNNKRVKKKKKKKKKISHLQFHDNSLHLFFRRRNIKKVKNNRLIRPQHVTGSNSGEDRIGDLAGGSCDQHLEREKEKEKEKGKEKKRKRKEKGKEIMEKNYSLKRKTK